MDPTVNLVGMEFIVADLDAAVRFCEQVLGLELLSRHASPDVAGDVAVLALGNAAITLLQPHAVGEGVVLPQRAPRLAQIFLGVPPGRLAAHAERMAAAGAPVQVLGPDRFFVPAPTVEDALGVATAVTVLAVEPDT